MRIQHFSQCVGLGCAHFAFVCRFGFSIANLGDLNKDGYEDVAIGAPYEGKGAVYIYLGSDKGLITEPAQVKRRLKASNL